MKLKFWKLRRSRRETGDSNSLHIDAKMSGLSGAVSTGSDFEVLVSSTLFDDKWYLEKYPDVKGSRADAARHYLDYGAAEGRDPHPLFSTRYYLAEYGELADAGINPFVHFITRGGGEHRRPHPLFDVAHYVSQFQDGFPAEENPLLHYMQHWEDTRHDPNPFFDTQWYLDQNPELLASKVSPLAHYIDSGEPNGRNPSPRFDIEWYLRCNIDVARAGVSPLWHYLLSGRSERRLRSRAQTLIGAVTDASIACLKQPSFTGDVALFVTHSPDGHIKPHVRHYLDSLHQNGIAVVLIVAADKPFEDNDEQYINDLNGVFVRQNHGFDFAAWAHVVRLHPEIFDCKTLYFINDSVVGPTNGELFSDIIQRVRASSADFIGLTDSHESTWHLQSFFIAFKRRTLQSAVFQHFIDEVVSFSDKNAVIAEYELGLTPKLLAADLRCEALFPQETTQPINRTLFHWKALLNRGFPFIKVSTIRDGHPDADTSGWAAMLASHGYDVSIARRTIARPQGTSGNGRADTEQPDFDEDFYLSIYPDIAAAGVDPRDHYVRHGRAEGRLGRRPKQLDALNDPSLIEASRETVLIVSHEGARGGAPVLSYNLARNFRLKYNVIVLFLADGPIVDETRDLGVMAIGPVGLAGSPELANLVVNEICSAVPISFAIANSIESRHVLPALARRFVPSLSLIHEFTAYIRPRNAFRDAVQWSGQVVFSTELTKDDAIASFPELGGRTYPIAAQGPCFLPKAEAANDATLDKDRARIQTLMRPRNFPAEGVVVVGAGYTDFRKGVDLFIECASRARSAAPDLPLRFAWAGRGYNPEADVTFSAYLADQLRRHGIENDVVFLGEVSDLAAMYDSADIFALTSRLDPLPNVAIDALTAGLPMVCFARTTGIADILSRNGLGERSVAGYLDTADLADKIVALARSKKLRGEVGLRSAVLAKTEFNMPQYIDELEQIGLQQVLRSRQERADIEIIADSDLPRMDYYLLPGHPHRPRKDIIADYVRSWASGVGRRKLFPGFHPGVYREQHGVQVEHADPLADFIRAGQPQGPWTSPLIEPSDPAEPIPDGTRIALHIHAYFLDVLPEIVERLSFNSVRPDLLVSVKSDDHMKQVQAQLRSYSGRVEARLVPDPGRDVGPFLTEFGDDLLNEYDLIGHVHTKTSADLNDNSVARIWVKFLSENVLGSAGNPMADIILGRMANDSTIGIVYPDDPHPVGWDANERFAMPYLANFGLTEFPRNLHIPVGAFFWARPEALRPMFDLKLAWSDYPTEPLPYDGSLLHALERLYGLSVSYAGFRIFNTYVPGVTR